METVSNMYHVEVDREKYDYTDIGNGVKLERDYSFHEGADETVNLMYFNYYSGRVKVSPRRLHHDFKSDDPIKPDSYVYFHHFVQDQVIENLPGSSGLNWANHDQIFCVVDGDKLIPREGKVIVEPILETEEDITVNGIKTKPHPEIIPERGIVRFAAPSDKEMQDIIGKVAVFQKVREYKIEIEGKDYYVMDSEGILGTL